MFFPFDKWNDVMDVIVQPLALLIRAKSASSSAPFLLFSHSYNRSSCDRTLSSLIFINKRFSTTSNFNCGAALHPCDFTVGPSGVFVRSEARTFDFSNSKCALMLKAREIVESGDFFLPDKVEIFESVYTQACRLSRPPALLADLQVPEGQLQPPFSSENFSYDVTIPDNVKNIHVTAKLALGKENDKYRVMMTSSNLETDMYVSTLILPKNASTIYVKVHVSSHKRQTSTYLLRVVSGPSSGPASHEDAPTGGADKRFSFGEALLNTIVIFGSAMAVSSLAMFLYGTLASVRSRQAVGGVEGYQPVGDGP
ncbi:hypothetical protein R1flu_022626 [Riccia fluitans]|uniref:Cadherin-like beta-sandwich-like domain-containing protein n=1 Tax=Riccia fluitans TaxID=41844 RepID=A0ABD1XQ78_9MARC